MSPVLAAWRREGSPMKPSVHLEQIAPRKLWIGCCTGDPQPENFITLGCGDFSVGRAISDDITLSDISVSRRHATLRVIDKRLSIQDNRSTNGTRINDGPQMGGRWFEPPPADPVVNWVEIQPSDLLRFGNVSVRILWVGEGMAPFTPPHLAWNGGIVAAMAGAILEDKLFGDLPILADALEDAGCCDGFALACFRRGEPSASVHYLLKLLLGVAPTPTIVNSRPMAKCPMPPYIHDPIVVVHFHLP
jgi:hypothetical protein